jgi:Fe-S-cluster-containing dehydrogenase component
MPKEKDEKTKDSRSPVSRREFLKDAGLLVGGAALGSAALMGACSGGTTTVTGPGLTSTKIATNTVTATSTTAVTGPVGPQGPKGDTGDTGPAGLSFKMPVAVALTKGVLVVNPEICCSCMNCMFACTLFKDGVAAPEIARIQLLSHNNYTFENPALPCLQCNDPQCLRYCPVGAITVDSTTGARVINQQLCIGCQTCIDSCPYTPPRVRFDSVKNKATKCDLCSGDPQCVKACPTGALSYFTNPDGVKSGYVQPKGRN